MDEKLKWQDAGYVKVEPAEKLSNKDFLALPIEQRRKLLKEQVEAFLKTNPDFRVNDGELAPCPLSEQCHDDMMADCEHCPYRRYAVAQLAHDKARMEELEATIVAAMSTIDGLTEDWEKSKRAMHEVQSICNYLMQDNTELAEKVAKIEKIVLLAQELLKLLKGEHDEA